jgi:S1/P1 Nuclease
MCRLGAGDIPIGVRMAGAKQGRPVSGSSLPVEPAFRLGRNPEPGNHMDLGRLCRSLESGWLTSQEAQVADGGTPTAWAEETHTAARGIWDEISERHVVDDAYYAKVLPVLDRQLGLTGLRMANLLNDSCSSQ